MTTSFISDYWKNYSKHEGRSDTSKLAELTACKYIYSVQYSSVSSHALLTG